MYSRSEVLALARQSMESDEEIDEHLLSLSDESLSRMLFHTPIGDETNLRLSMTGYEMLSKTFESYEQIFPENYHITSRDLLFLSERCSCPYFVSSKAKIFGFFETELATHVKLVGGNLSLIV